MIANTPLKLALGAVLSIFLFACGGGTHEGGGATTTVDTLDTAAAHSDGGVVKVGNKLFSIPSPVQTAMLIHKLGLGYQKELPLAGSKVDVITTKNGRSLALGMYGADLAYVTMYKDGARALALMQTVEKLGGQLELANAFDKTLIDRFKKNISSEDSLLRLSGEAFRSADMYLKTNKRDDVSALVLAGGWIESLYLTVSSGKGGLDQNLANRLGEQKRTLNDLVALIDQSDEGKTCTDLVAQLKDLQSAFSGISSTYVFQKPVTEASARTTHIQSTSTVVVTPEQMNVISAKVKSIREKILA